MAESVLKGLVGKKQTMTYKFMDTTLTINKLSVAQVLEIQEMAANADGGEKGFELLKRVIVMSIPDTEDLSPEDWKTFSMDDLSKLSNQIMKFSGLEDKGK